MAIFININQFFLACWDWEVAKVDPFLTSPMLACISAAALPLATPPDPNPASPRAVLPPLAPVLWRPEKAEPLSTLPWADCHLEASVLPSTPLLPNPWLFIL